MRSTTIYRRGVIVLVPFPYTDQSGSKRRPALILSSTAYNSRRDEIIFAPITSNLSTGQVDDTLLSAWATAGLPKPSVVKGVLASIEKSLIIRVLGELSSGDLKRVEKTFANILGLAVPLPPPSP